MGRQKNVYFNAILMNFINPRAIYFIYNNHIFFSFPGMQWPKKLIFLTSRNFMSQNIPEFLHSTWSWAFLRKKLKALCVFVKLGSKLHTFYFKFWCVVNFLGQNTRQDLIKKIWHSNGCITMTKGHFFLPGNLLCMSKRKCSKKAKVPEEKVRNISNTYDRCLGVFAYAKLKMTFLSNFWNYLVLEET